MLMLNVEQGAPMTLGQLLVKLGKLLLCAVAYEVGLVIGGILAGLLKLQAPASPAGADMSRISFSMVLVSPLFALALAVIARRIGGSLLTRMGMLSFFMWISYTVNTQLEASIVSTYASGVAFSVVSGAVPALFCGAAVAFLFAPENEAEQRRAAYLFHLWPHGASVHRRILSAEYVRVDCADDGSTPADSLHPQRALLPCLPADSRHVARYRSKSILAPGPFAVLARRS
jgi:hypothetical protein